MSKSNPKSIRLTPDDEAIVEAVREKKGVQSLGVIVSMALRALAREESIVLIRTDGNPEKSPKSR
ncbi:MAG: hypothetical protein OHK0029_06270 [Armatimonadaceae bacterium]